MDSLFLALRPRIPAWKTTKTGGRSALLTGSEQKIIQMDELLGGPQVDAIAQYLASLAALGFDPQSAVAAEDRLCLAVH